MAFIFQCESASLKEMNERQRIQHKHEHTRSQPSIQQPQSHTCVQGVDHNTDSILVAQLEIICQYVVNAWP